MYCDAVWVLAVINDLDYMLSPAAVNSSAGLSLGTLLQKVWQQYARHIKSQHRFSYASLRWRWRETQARFCDPSLALISRVWCPRMFPFFSALWHLSILINMAVPVAALGAHYGTWYLIQTALFHRSNVEIV